jgi:hypothetical protein
MEANAIKLIKEWGEKASNITTCSGEFWNIVEEADLDYGYLNQRAGGLQVTAMDDCLGPIQIYESGGISVWLLKK